MKMALNYASAVFALASAALWFWACFVSVVYKPKPDAAGWTSAAITSNGYDVIASAKRQLLWNAAAAASAGIAALFQATAVLISN